MTCQQATVRVRYGPASTEQVLGALPVAAGLCRRLDIAGIIDRAVPAREIAHATHGQVIEALIANRLTAPSPMIHVAAWARQFAIEHALGLDPGVLDDDRIARALDALAPVAEQVTGSVGAAAIGAYGIDVSQLHWDMTSISLYGDYPACDTDFPQPEFGHPKDRRPDLKQIQAGAATAAGGAVPYIAERDTTRPAEQRGRYRVVEDTMTITGPRKKDPSYAVRRVFVYSSARAAAARTKKLDRARDDPRLALRPGRHRRRGRHRRLVRAADQPARHHHRRGRGGALQKPARHQRTPLPRPEGAPRRRADVPAHPPAHRRTHRRALPRPAHLLPRRTRSPPQPRPRHQPRRPLRRPTRQTHRRPDLHRPRHATAANRHRRRHTRNSAA
ncbi:DUF4277 domain-containing protein [Candidatus Mycobacterium methanotrophicum]|uniref:DUF4277 domain-containing protein n=1 Tax=Candidatus Mycobacterium methanotrophicum TaxID=2943498 RepID=A0ABY4QQC4_9MYCO|nr:DUF4277 domain-containing protein [Candidatus Mycobacterium methanotrophicum]UQX12442.1 DUF4277 domain-containing protein [Candidatus Mycobacterium methanotrophicum]